MKLGLGLSEEARLVYLQEKIKDAKRHERSGWIAFIVGVIFAVIGFGFSDLIGLGGTLIGVAGIILAIVGVFESFYFLYQYNKSMKELEKMAIPTPKCPKCGKELPKGDFTFCPFCGASLKS